MEMRQPFPHMLPSSLQGLQKWTFEYASVSWQGGKSL